MESNQEQGHAVRETATHGSAMEPPTAPAGGLPAARGVNEPPGGEAELWRGRASWRSFVGTLILWVILLAVWAVMGVLAVNTWALLGSQTATIVVLALTLLTTLEFLGRRVIWRILGLRYRLTNERLFLERGVLSLTTDQTELVRVDDVRVHQSFIDRVLGVGTVEIVSTDATHQNIRIEGIVNSVGVAESIRNSMRALRRRSLYVENI